MSTVHYVVRADAGRPNDFPRTWCIAVPVDSLGAAESMIAGTACRAASEYWEQTGQNATIVNVSIQSNGRIVE